MSKQLNALVVDDGQIEQKLMAHYLSQVEAYKVECFAAMDSAQAVDILNNQNIDICFIDYYLDGETGTDLIEKLNILGIEAPIVIISGLDQAELNNLVAPFGVKRTIAKEELSGKCLEDSIKEIFD